MNCIFQIQNFKSTFILTLFLFSAFALLDCSSVHKTETENEILILSKKVSLPHVSGRIDHIAYDALTHRVFIAALGNNTVEVVDMNEGKVIRSVGGVKEPQGVLFIPSLNRLVVSNGGDGKVSFFDAKDFTLLGTVDLKEDADNMRYDPSSNLVYVGYGSGGIAIIDAGMMRQTGNIPLDGHPESFQLDKQQNRLYVNVPAKGKIEVADVTSMQVIENWKTDALKSNFPMAIDETGHRLFVACRGLSELKIIDTDTGENKRHAKCAGDADDVFYDDTDSLVFVSGGNGFIDIFRSDENENISIINRIITAHGARTSLWLQDERKLLLAVPMQVDNSAELFIYDLKTD